MENPNHANQSTTGSTPKFGLASLVLSLIPFPYTTLWFGLVILTSPAGGSSMSPRIQFITVGFEGLGLLAPLIGVALGIVSLKRREPKRGVAIAGIVVGILTAIGIAFVLYQMRKAAGG
jgi:hypothetical protein